jgi:hypothetical protein
VARAELAAWLRSELVERLGSVEVEREAVDHEGVAEEVEVLAGVADAVGASEPHGVVEVAVDALVLAMLGKQPRIFERDVRRSGRAVVQWDDGIVRSRFTQARAME